MKYTVYSLRPDFTLTVLDRNIPTSYYAIVSDKVFYFIPSLGIKPLEVAIGNISRAPHLYHSRSSVFESPNFEPEMLTEIATFNTIKDLEPNYPELFL